MSVCDDTCKPCTFSSVMAYWGLNCNYILVTGNRRGCPAGEKCERRKLGPKRRSIDGMFYNKSGLDEAERKKKYQHEWYLKHKEEYRLKSKAQYEAKKAIEQKTPKQPTYSNSRKKKLEMKTKALYQGRQTETIERYLTENGLTPAKLALMIGVKEGTVRKWRLEYNGANWEKLAQVGIQKPTGIEQVKEKE